MREDGPAGGSRREVHRVSVGRLERRGVAERLELHRNGAKQDEDGNGGGDRTALTAGHLKSRREKIVTLNVRRTAM